MQLDDLLKAALARPGVLALDNAAAELGGGLLAYRAQRPQRPEHRVYEPAFALVLQGRKAVSAGDRMLEIGPGQSLLIGVDLAVTSRVTEAPYLALSVRPDPALLRDIAAVPDSQGGRVLPDSPALPVAILDADARLLDAMGRLLALLDSPRALSALGLQALREVHFWMLESRHGPLLCEIARIGGPAERIAKAVALIRADPAQPIRVPDLARRAGLSASAFHAHFRAVTATTPLQFQKRLRLIEARSRLRAGAPVSEAAFAVGYESPTQFAREYRRMFGSPPREARIAAAAG